MKGSLKASLVGAFKLLALFAAPAGIAWGNAIVVAVPATGPVAQVTTGTGINRPLLRSGSQGVAVSELQAALKLLGYYTGTVDGIYSESTVLAVSRFQQAAGLNPDGIVNSATWERLFPLAPPKASSPSASTNSGQAQGQPLRAAAFPVPSATRTTPAAPNRSASNNTSATNSKPASASGSRSPTRSPSAEGNLPVLRLGMRGSAVTRLQQRLQAAGLFKGGVDGVFGPKTEEAVKAAQRRYRLKPDGVVGPATWRNLLPQPSRNK